MVFLYNLLKRMLDFVFSSIALIVLSPIFVITAIAIKLDSQGPIFYKQIRIGKNLKPFEMYKFRSMCDHAESQIEELKSHNERIGPCFKIKNDPRVTKVGKIIRKYSIDELPQLINVVKGDMSLVGPRPALPEEVANYTEEEMKRLSVPQGLTCLWQVYERDNPDFQVQVNLDKQYIKHRCFWLDLKLIFLTIPSVLSGKHAC